jgi:hypothetical protein
MFHHRWLTLAVKVTGAQFPLVFAAAEHAIGDPQNLVSDGEDRFVVAEKVCLAAAVAGIFR